MSKRAMEVTKNVISMVEEFFVLDIVFFVRQKNSKKTKTGIDKISNAVIITLEQIIK